MHDTLLFTTYSYNEQYIVALRVLCDGYLCGHLHCLVKDGGEVGGSKKVNQTKGVVVGIQNTLQETVIHIRIEIMSQTLL